MLYLNNKPVNVTMFSDNTSQVWKVENIDPEADLFKITWEYSHEGEIMHLAQLVDLIKEIKEVDNERRDRWSKPTIDLHMPYLPYARQDKEISNKTTFALRSFCKILKSMKLSSISVVDQHSHVYSSGVYFRTSYPKELVEKLFDKLSADMVCYPDKGALNKYRHQYDLPFMFANKERDQLTGSILNMTLKGNPENRNILIVDDICDAGGTFSWLTKLLKDAGANEVNLFVTHGIFSKGLKPLKDCGIIDIYTKDGKISEVQGNICYDRI